ncbi:MAG TPA: hypothetical protein VGN56_00250 [Candidatus Paceibacterota bacterium]|jgi:hypothetical protein|nr:hypothetical protein [Candidatus Paceibacterota bacterium]
MANQANQTQSTSPIKILKGALDELPDGSIILRGVIDQESLRLIRADSYQRGQMMRKDIMEGYESGAQLPDVELGMRGQDFDSNRGTFMLKDSVYAIDGWQRITTALRYLDMVADGKVHLGAMIRFDTTEEYERQRFETLNGSSRAKVSANIMIRNKKGDSSAVLMLYGLSHTDKAFVLQDRIAWGQNMARGELLSAFSLVKIVGRLHAHKIPGGNSRMDLLVAALDRGVDIFGVQVMRENVKAFFGLVDECWGIRRIHYRDGASYMKAGFLGVLARVLSDHEDFWNQQSGERRLFVEAPLRRKLAQFPVNDPTVVQLSGAAGKGMEMLYMMLRDHLNRGKTTKRLVSRYAEGTSSFSEEEDAA